MKKLSTLLIALLGVIPVAGQGNAIAAEQADTLEEMIIIGIREDRKSRGATGLDLSIYETPQSLSILEAGTIDDFGLTDINSLLKMTTGVNVDSTETDRTYYNARGFDITSMHIDGVGVPFGNLIVGDLDTAIYDKVAVIRGANGLITGLGNPSGTVNYIRKRPTNEVDASLQLTTGRWNDQRIVADVNLPITESGSWAGRIVGVYQDSDSWLNLNSNNRNVFYGVVDGQINDDVTLTFSYARQENLSDGVLWGAAPMIYSDGTPASFDISTTTSMEWTYWDTLTKTAYAEMGWRISNNLQLTTSLTHTDYEEGSELFYVYWLNGLDADTGLGMFSYPGKYDGEQETLVWDTTLQGAFSAWGQEHEFNLGLSIADADSHDQDYGALEGFVAMPSFPGWQGNEVPRPEWAAPYVAAEDDMSLNRLYGSLLLSVTDELKLILGMSFVDYENSGVSWGVSTDSSEDGESPYVGFTWEVAEDLNLYGSYSDIYQPQYYLDENLQPLGSAEGESFELGLKKQFDNKLLVTLALFRTEQQNLQEFVEYGDGDGVDDTDFSDDFDFALYRGISVESEGVELEVVGYVTESLRVQAGYTYLDMKDPNGGEARTFIPRKTFKLLTEWTPDWNEKLAMGFSARWQDDVHFASAYGPISQDSYAVLGGYLSYHLNEAVRLSVNVDNIADEHYLSSVKYEQSFFASPRSYSVSLDWHL